jgi:hypothetical protein
MIVEIPTRSDGDRYAYQMKVALSGIEHIVRLVWSVRTEHWHVSLYRTDGDAVIENRVVVNGINLLRGSGTTLPGALYALPTDGVNEHADLTGLGSRVRLYYEEPD